MSNAVDRERELRDDHCPACGEGIDWEDGRHWLMFAENAFCAVEHEWFGLEAVLDLAHLGD